MPGSTHDNYALRDANSAQITFRSMDVSVAQDGSFQRSMVLMSPYPVDYGWHVGGSYRANLVSGSIAAGLAAASPVLSMRNTSTTMNVILRRLKINGFTLSAGFTAGLISLQAFVARTFTAIDSGGTPYASRSMMRSGLMVSSLLNDLRISSTGTLTAGTRTLDPAPVAREDFQAPTGANAMFLPSAIDFLDQKESEHPLMLGTNEGLIIQATVPATGVWGLSVTPVWDEVPVLNY